MNKSIEGRTFKLVTIITRQAFLSGIFAATSSCVAKLALDPKSRIPTVVCALFMDASREQLGDAGDSAAGRIACDMMSLVLSRGASFLVVILLNGMMMSKFLDGIEESGSIAATALSTAANFTFSVSYF